MVVAILTILVSLVAGGAQMARRKAAIAAAKTRIAGLDVSITTYYGDLSVYPPSGNANLVTALTEDPDDVDWQGPYEEFKQDELVNGEVIDPWGQPYVYVSVADGSPQHRPYSYDLYSIGLNGADESGDGDDLGNW